MNETHRPTAAPAVLRHLAVATAALLIAFTGMTVRAAPARADSLGASGTEVVSAGVPSVYGEPLTVRAVVWDNSDSCNSIFNACDFPVGHVDFYAVQGAVQTYMTTGDLFLDFGGTYFRANGYYRVTDEAIDTQLVTCCLDPGSYKVRAYYVPGNFDASSDDSDYTVNIAKADSSIGVTQSSSSTAVGQEVTFNIEVHNANADADARAQAAGGFVDIREGNTIYGSATLGAGAATIKTTALPAGSHSLTVHYTGDDRYNGLDSTPISHTVAAGATSSSLGASSNSITYGDSVTLTDTVGAVAPATGSPTGSVTFSDGATSLGSQPLNEGTPDTATLSTSALAAGSHTISATYDGDDSFTGSTSNSVTINVAKGATSTTLGSSTNPSAFGQGVTFTASVSGPGTTTPTGTVQFRDGATAIGAPQSVIAGVASLTIGSLAGGSHSVSAVYSGNANLLGSTSNTVAQVVTCDQMITGTVSSVTATSGSTCLSGAKVSGNVTVSGSGSLSIVNSTVSGGITATGSSTAVPAALAPTTFNAVAPAITICGSTVAGNVSITGMSGFLLLGDRVDDACAGNWLKGSVMLSGNSGGLALADNRIGGYAKVINNVGAGPSPDHVAPLVAANVIGGYLVVSGNSPAATDDGRPNHFKRGQLAAF